MIKIIEVVPKRNNRYQLNILKDDQRVSHILSEITMFKHDLFFTKTLSEKKYKEVIKSAAYDLLFEKALNYISYQMRTISEVKKHLRKDTKDEAVIQKIIDELKTKNYVSDIKYTEEYINQKLEFDLVGPRYIKEKLIGKGIHFDLIDQYLIQYKEDIQFDKIYQIIKNETKYPIKKPYSKAYNSIKRKLINKGFSLSIIDSSLISNNELIKDAVVEDDLLQKDFDKTIKKHDITTFEGKQKAIQALLRKGYNYSRVKRLFE